MTLYDFLGCFAGLLQVKVWNSTVANLTLMALGSSAPEILLSVPSSEHTGARVRSPVLLRFPFCYPFALAGGKTNDTFPVGTDNLNFVCGSVEKETHRFLIAVVGLPVGGLIEAITHPWEQR